MHGMKLHVYKSCLQLYRHVHDNHFNNWHVACLIWLTGTHIKVFDTFLIATSALGRGHVPYRSSCLEDTHVLSLKVQQRNAPGLEPLSSILYRGVL